MTDLKPFKHGEEGTHSVCDKHNMGGKSVCCECSGKDGCGETNTIETIMTELKQRRDWNNPEEVEIWFEEKLRWIEAIAEERARLLEGTHLVMNNFETWRKQYHEDKDLEKVLKAYITKKD